MTKLRQRERARRRKAEEQNSPANRQRVLAKRGGDLAMIVGHEDDCLDALGEAVEINPDDFRSRLTMAFVLLRQGRYAEAWPHYSLAMTDQARDTWLWDGSETLAGQSIAIRYDRELGLGDWIFGARYVRPLAELANRVVLEVPTKLKSLAFNWPDTVIERAGA